MYIYPAVAAVFLANACMPSVPYDAPSYIERRGAADLECARVVAIPARGGRMIVAGCDRWVAYSPYRLGRYMSRTWLLDSPVHQGSPSPPGAARPFPDGGRCVEGHDCPAGFGCRIEGGAGTCQPLCHDAKGDPEFCYP